jgi:hypothetical protein
MNQMISIDDIALAISAGVYRRDHILESLFSPSGDRNRRPRTTAVPLSCRLGCRARPGEVRAARRLRTPASGPARTDGHRPSLEGTDHGEGAGHRRLHARQPLYPDRQRCLCRGQQVLWAGDPKKPSRQGRGRERQVPLQGQVRKRLEPRSIAASPGSFTNCRSCQVSTSFSTSATRAGIDP